MKLWKTLKTVGGNRAGCDPKAASSFASSSQTVDAFELEEMNQRRTSESPDSGLPGERLAKRAIIHLDRRRGGDLGLLLAGRSEPGLLPTVAGFKKDSSVQDADRFAPGDRICSINGIATARLTNEEVMALLNNVEERASLEIEYYLPNYDSQSSLCITSRVAQVPVEREAGSLGVTLRAAAGGTGAPCGGTARPGALLVTHVRANGPAHRTHRIKPGDRLLKVDNISLANKSLAEAYQILQNCPPITNLMVEYDISIMESVKFATGPLLIEIERGCNENLGLVLTDKSYNEECFGASANYLSADGHPGIFVESIIPASISDRCGALHPGDQILAVDDLTVDNASYTPEEVMCYMENCSGKGFTQLQILPVHMLLKNYRMGKARGQQPGSPVSGMSTLNSRKSHRQNRQLRQSSVPKSFEMDPDYLHNNFVTGVGVCRSEILSLQLEIPPNHDSGITVCEDRELLLVSHITHQSPAYRSGCLQLGDRIIFINSQQNLTANAANDVLQKRNDTNCTRYLNIKAEFSMADSVEASSGVFNVKLAKNGAGLGVTITGNKQRGPNTEEPMIISNIKVGSVAYRSGTLAVGDQLIAIDSQPLHNLSLDAAFNILQNFPDDIITLTVRKMDTRNDWRDVRNNTIKPLNFGYGMTDTPPSMNSSVKSGSMYARVQQNNQVVSDTGHNSTDDGNTEREINFEETIFDIELMKQNDGPLGLTIAGSEDATQPIVLSGLVKGGLAEKSGALKIGDHILSINGQSVHQKPLSEAINMLQNSSHRILLKVLRKGQCGVPSKISDPAKMEKNLFNSRDSSTFTNNSQSSPGLASIDSAVESWDSQPAASNMTRDNLIQGKDDTDPTDNDFQGNSENRLSYLPTDENKLLASGYRIQEHIPNDSNDLPLPNYSFTNTMRTFKADKMINQFATDNCNSNRFKLNDNFSQNYDGTNNFIPSHNYNNNNSNNETYCDNDPHMFNKPDSNGGSYKSDSSPFNMNPPQLRSTAYTRNHENNSDSGSSHNNSGFVTADNNGQRRNFDGQRNMGNFQLPTNYQLPGSSNSNYDTDFPGFYNMDSITNQGTIHHVTLYKDVIYDDYGFSVSDGLYERGVYINRIRKGGPADIVGLLRPFDRILQVNGTRTVDFDCCLTVPLIASAGDRIELVLQRLKDSWSEDNNSNTLETNNVVTKTI